MMKIFAITYPESHSSVFVPNSRLRNKEFLSPSSCPIKPNMEGGDMKRLSLLVAVSAVLVAASATAAQAQVVLGGTGASVTVATPVTPLAGTVLIEDSGARRLPSGYNETGRLARYMGDSKLMKDDIQFSNRDFEAWKPIESTSKARVDRRLMGSPRSYNHPIADFETGRLIRDMSQDNDGRLLRNNVILSNRDFRPLKPIYAPNSKSMVDRRVRGLATGTNVINARRVAIRLMQPSMDVWF
jgi:hypothetical protein